MTKSDEITAQFERAVDAVMALTMFGTYERFKARYVVSGVLQAVKDVGDWAHEHDGVGTAPTVFRSVIEDILEEGM